MVVSLGYKGPVPGPRTEVDALRWIQDAMQAGRYVLSKHFRLDRLEQRGLAMDDLYSAIERATGIERYERRPVNDGTCWRVLGPSLAEELVAVGVEAFYDRQRRRVVICTIFIIAGANE